MGEIFVDVWNVESRPLDVMAGLSFVTRPPNGAESLFVGTVRELNQGKKVLGVSYDVFEPLARQSFTDICKEAQEKWGKELVLYVVHGKGRLDVGGISIVIAAGSPHRDEAFKACRYIIEQIKHRSPIWKLEHYADGDSEWTQGCELCTHEHKAEEEHHHG
ncbi:MAG: molybdenum cofactor biosynthesis protein MoaE [Rickettsiales bacterium]|nr:molybdenum cofactor biosynthesis protein MoaE [Rickettsiales bacterium]